MKWEEPFDSTLYCVQSDGHYAVITGTARHGLVRLWDKRQTRPVQVGTEGPSIIRDHFRFHVIIFVTLFWSTNLSEHQIGPY